VARHTFLDKGLLYLFSYNVEVDMDVDNIGLSPDGLRVNIRCIPNSGRVYHVLGERAVGGLGVPIVTGQLKDGVDHAVVRDDDVTMSNVRATIQTDDGELIDSSYPGVCFLGQGGFQGFVSDKDKYGKLLEPLLLPVVVAPRFETASRKYQWLAELQCIGFGRLAIVKNVLRAITYDIYAMN
jgi:hypothetical protein